MAARTHFLRLSWHQWVLAGILCFASFTRLWRLDYPRQYYFDEVYHVVTAKLMAQNNPAAYEWWHPAPEPNTAIDWLHPPLAKLFQAASIHLLGNTSFAWRISSALFGIATVALVYVLARQLKLPPGAALLAAFLYSLDGLALGMSRITMNDAHVSFFFLLCSWLYLRWKEQPSHARALFVGLAAGLATASKWSGIFTVGFIIVDLLREHCRASRSPVQNWRAVGTLALSLTILVPTLYLVSYGQMFLQGKGWAHLRELHQQIWWYQTNLTATHPYQSVPWQWILDARPVYAHVEPGKVGELQNIYFQGNPFFFWAGAAAALWIGLDWLGSVGLKMQLLRRALAEQGALTAEKFRSRWKKITDSLPYLEAQVFLLLAYLSTWVVWVKSPRIMFFYHYTPALPFLALMLASLLFPAWKRGGVLRLMSAGLVTLIALTFVLFYPNWTGIAVPAKPFTSLYFFFPGWR